MCWVSSPPAVAQTWLKTAVAPIRSRLAAGRLGIGSHLSASELRKLGDCLLRHKYSWLGSPTHLSITAGFNAFFIERPHQNILSDAASVNMRWSHWAVKEFKTSSHSTQLGLHNSCLEFFSNLTLFLLLCCIAISSTLEIPQSHIRHHRSPNTILGLFIYYVIQFGGLGRSPPHVIL